MKQDLSKWAGIHGESFWRNARFRLDATQAERRSFSHTLEVHKLGDVIDSSTNRPRTFVNWRDWINTYYDAGGAPMEEDAVDDLARRMMELVDQVPRKVMLELCKPLAEHAPKKNEIVLLVEPDQQGQSGQYARYDGVGYREVWIDTYSVAHDTGVRIPSGIVAGLSVKQVSMWHTQSGERVMGPSRVVFPQVEGWIIDGKKVRLTSLGIKTMTRAMTMRAFVPSAAERGWEKRLGRRLRWKLGW